MITHADQPEVLTVNRSTYERLIRRGEQCEIENAVLREAVEKLRQELTASHNHHKLALDRVEVLEKDLREEAVSGDDDEVFYYSAIEGDTHEH